ncbi:MAG: hypothetical protein ACOC16_00835 [Nanoarchaeota archaeon]
MAKDQSMTEIIVKNHKKTNYIFLGIGLTLFVMNITAFISFVKDVSYDYMFFNTAIFSSIIIILMTVHYITEADK